jgi:glucose-1-phosphate cytidylyltransferase
MKVVIFAGGFGTRISEESHIKPKPMIEIGEKPILWHIMKIYSHYGIDEFIICLGYKGHVIKEYFINYFLYNSDITVELHNNQLDVHFSNSESFKVTLIDTGLTTNTAGRLQKVKPYLNDETFMLTYGDGVADINIHELIKFHRATKKYVTLTAVQPPGRFGNIEIDSNSTVSDFQEKPRGDGIWINGGFFVLEPEIFNFLDGNMDKIQWEKKPLIEIAKQGQLAAYKHYGYWKCMDAIRDKVELEEDWNSGNAKWKVW